MLSLPSFDQSTETLSPEQYQEHLRAVELAEISLESATAKLDRSIYSENEGQLAGSVSSTGTVELVPGDTPDVIVAYEIKGRKGRKSVLSVKLQYRLKLAVLNDPPPTEFYVIYAALSANTQVWPFARELANSLTARMNVSPVLLPLLKPTAKD